MARNGIAIAYITDGTLDVRWVTRVYTELAANIPSGIFWKMIYVRGKDYRKNGGYAAARNKIVDIALEENVKKIMWIDTDVFVPVDCITRLMSTGKRLVSGVYYMKKLPPQPILYKKLGDGPYWRYPVNKVFKIEAAGFGCVLEDMKVIDKFDKEGVPYFKENWVYTKPNGKKVKVKIGEDYWHFVKAKELGVQPYCHSGVLCDHVDYSTWKIYPGEKEVERITKKWNGKI